MRAFSPPRGAGGSPAAGQTWPRYKLRAISGCKQPPNIYHHTLCDSKKNKKQQISTSSSTSSSPQWPDWKWTPSPLLWNEACDDSFHLMAHEPVLHLWQVLVRVTVQVTGTGGPSLSATRRCTAAQRGGGGVCGTRNNDLTNPPVGLVS